MRPAAPLRLLAHAGGTAELDRVHRFLDPAEAEATLRLRAGQVCALGFYEAAGRLSDGSREVMIDEVYDGWKVDLAAGRASLMVSGSSAEVAALSARARRDWVVAGGVESDGLGLHDGNQAGVGDLIVTRQNQRALTVCGGRDFVKNGDIWAVTRRHANGDLTARHQDHGGSVRLASSYVAANVELGYATTVHRAQGMTVDAAHVLVDKTLTRESLYVALSRGRAANRAYVVTDEALDVDLHVPPGPRLDALDVLRGVLARESSERSASESISATLEAAESLATLVPQYLDGSPGPWSPMTSRLRCGRDCAMPEAGILMTGSVPHQPGGTSSWSAPATNPGHWRPRPFGHACSTAVTLWRTLPRCWPGGSSGSWPEILPSVVQVRLAAWQVTLLPAPLFPVTPGLVTLSARHGCLPRVMA